jgi:ubiquinol-cytochrome c reductase cytochrome b subunit
VLKDSVAALAVLAVVLGLTIYFGGAELTAPADPANPYNAARPEWYFLFLFQFLKWFPGELEVWGAFIVPAVIIIVLFLMPWIGRAKAGHIFNIGLLCLLLGAAAALTAQAIYEDYFARWNKKEDILAANDPVLAARYEASERFLEAKKQAQAEAERVIELAKSAERIPPTGALSLAYDDPYLQGPKLFKQNCAGCHNHEGRATTDLPAGMDATRYAEIARESGINFTDIVNESPTAPNLWEVGNRRWVQGILSPRQLTSPNFFGYQASPFADGEMVGFIKDCFPEDLRPDKRQKIEEALLKVSDALWNEAETTKLLHPDARAVFEKRAAEGRELLSGGLAELLDSGTSCTDCHKFHESGDLGLAPDLTGYMSRQWMIEFIRNPAAERFYGDKNDRMPAFAPHDDPQLNQLDDKSLALIVDWLRGDWPGPGAQEAAAPTN